jgi:hypothetical protein
MKLSVGYLAIFSKNRYKYPFQVVENDDFDSN